MIDRHRIPGRFIILGSASPSLLKNSTETLAGRISYTELSPFILPEISGLHKENMLAYNHGHLLNMSTLSKALGISVPTVGRYLDYLEQSFFIRRLPPYYINLNKRLIKSPKIYIRDNGILHHLLGIPTFNDVMGHMVVGQSWEGFVINQIISYYGNYFDYSFYRTQDGTECDLVISRNINVICKTNPSSPY